MIHRQPTLTVHFSRAIILRVFFFSLIFISLLEILGLLDKMPVIFERGQGIRGVAYYCMLRLPTLFELGLPLSFLLGSVFFLVQLNQKSEIAAYRAAGLSTSRLFLLMIPAALVMSVPTLMIKDGVAPRAESAYQDWWAMTAQSSTSAAQDLWFHMSDKIVRVADISREGGLLKGVEFYQHGDGYSLTALTSFPRLVFRSGAWHASDVTRLESRAGRFEVISSAPSNMTVDLPKPPELMKLLQTPPVFSISRLWASFCATIPTSQPTNTYLVALLGYLSLPIKLCVMLFVALPTVFIPPRMGTRSILPVATLAIGILYLIIQGLFDALANAGTLPVLFSLVAAPSLVILLVGAWLIKQEFG